MRKCLHCINDAVLIDKYGDPFCEFHANERQAKDDELSKFNNTIYSKTPWTPVEG